jgi:HSP20 family protein
MNIVPKKSSSTAPDNLMSQMFETNMFPSVDIREKDNKYLLDADLPGMKDTDISMDFHNNTLTIQGEKKSESEIQDEGYVCVERSYGSFRRDIPFRDDIDQDSIKAELTNGVLHVELTKKERPKETHRKIQIKH